MDETLIARLEALERRVARLERRGVFFRPAPSPEPGASSGAPAGARAAVAEILPPAPRPRLARAAAGAGTVARRPAVAPGVETWLGSVLLGRVGIAAVLLAAAYFAQLAYRHVSDPMKVLSLYGVAGALLAVGALLRRRVAPRYVGLLWGGAVAVAYLAGLAATLRYHLVVPWVGLALLAGAAALGQVLAHRLRQQVLAVVAVAAAQVAPLTLGVFREPTLLVLAYASGVHAWGLFTERRYGWRATRLVAFAGAAIVGLAWSLAQHQGLLVPALAVQAFALSLLVPEIQALLGARAVPGAQPALARVLLTLAAADALTHADGFRGIEGAPFPAFAASVGLAWIGFAWLAAARSLGEGARRVAGAFAGVGALLLVVGAPKVLEGMEIPWVDLRYVGLAGGVALLALLQQRRTGAGDGGAALAALLVASWVGSVPVDAARDALALLPLAGLATAFLGRHPAARVLGLFLAAGTVHVVFLRMAQEAGWRGAVLGPTSAWLALSLVVPALLLLVGEAAARRRADDFLAGAVRVALAALALLWVPFGMVQARVGGLPAPWDPHTAAALGLAGASVLAWRRTPEGLDTARRLGRVLPGVAVALALVAGGREVFLATRDLPEAWPAVAMSVYLTVAGGLLLAAGFRWGLAGLRWTAIGLFGVVVGKVGLHDLAGASLPLRVLVTGLLGLVLLASAFAYSRRRRGDDAPGGPEGAAPEARAGDLSAPGVSGGR